MSQAILVGRFLVGRLGVFEAPARTPGRSPACTRRWPRWPWHCQRGFTDVRQAYTQPSGINLSYLHGLIPPKDAYPPLTTVRKICMRRLGTRAAARSDRCRPSGSGTVPRTCRFGAPVLASRIGAGLASSSEQKRQTWLVPPKRPNMDPRKAPSTFSRKT